MIYLKAFIAGLVLPSVLLPIALCLAVGLGKPELLTVTGVHWLPIYWGLWNVLYIAFGKKILPFSINARLLVTGAVLGLLVASYAIFWVNFPAVVGLPEQLKYLPLIGGPIGYALLWRFIVKPLNALLGVETR